MMWMRFRCFRIPFLYMFCFPYCWTTSWGRALVPVSAISLTLKSLASKRRRSAGTTSPVPKTTCRRLLHLLHCLTVSHDASRVFGAMTRRGAISPATTVGTATWTSLPSRSTSGDSWIHNFAVTVHSWRESKDKTSLHLELQSLWPTLTSCDLHAKLSKQYGIKRYCQAHRCLLGSSWTT